jgi:hypothetical protein
MAYSTGAVGNDLRRLPSTAISGRYHCAEVCVSRAPWEYLLIPFDPINFKPMWAPTWQLALGLLVLTVFFYNFQGRRLHNHPVFLDLNEWLMWTSVGVFSLLLMYTVFAFDFIFVLPTMLGGAFLFLWIRFVHFPPMIEAYEHKLARQRYFQRSRTAHPEATIRSKTASRSKRRRR